MTSIANVTTSHREAYGGSNDDANLVNLTAAEHFIAHYLLYRIHSGTSDGHKMACALYMMCQKNGNQQRIITPKQYEMARRAFSAFNKGEKHPMYGKHHSVETKAKMSATRKGKPTWNKGVSLSEEYRAKLSTACKGIPPWNKCGHLSEEHRAKLRESHKGNQINKGRHSYYDKDGNKFMLFASDPRVISHEVLQLNEFRASKIYK